jgi:hypothetical protein
MIKKILTLGEAFTAIKNVESAREVIQKFCYDRVSEEFKDKPSLWYAFWDYNISGDTLIIEYDYGTYGTDIEFRDSIKVDMRQFLRDEKIEVPKNVDFTHWKK